MNATTIETKTLREHAQEVMARLERLLAGEAVDGIRLGDYGVDREWAERSLAVYRDLAS